MNFSQAIEAMKAGKKIKRARWDFILYVDNDGDVITPFDCIECDNIVDSGDLMADDWEIVE